MPTFVMLTRLPGEALHQPRSITTLERHVSEALAADCPDVKWIGSYAVLGPCDYLDLFEAPDIEAATRVSVLVRSHGHAHTEVWPAMPWQGFKALLRHLPAEPAR